MKENYVLISGEVVNVPKFSHIVGKKKMYQGFVKVLRKSGYADVLPFFINKQSYDAFQFEAGKKIGLVGRYKSHNFYSQGKMKTRLFIYCNSVCETTSEDANLVKLNGFICKEPRYRNVPFDREVTDVVIAVNRLYGNADYIPCICWGADARRVASMKVGEPIEIDGRIQSREYWKKLNSGAFEPRIAYEVSVSRVY